MWPVFVIFVAIALAGGGVGLFAVNMARRRAVLSVIGDRLIVRETGLFRNRRSEWTRDEIADIRSGDAGWFVGQHEAQRVLQLQIHTRSGAKVALLSRHAEADLEWIAGALRGALQLGQDSSGTAEH